MTRKTISVSESVFKLLDAQRQGQTWDSFLQHRKEHGSPPPMTAPSHEPIGELKLEPCGNRIQSLSKGYFYCVTKPPKAVMLVDLLVCQVCMALRWGIKDRNLSPTQEIDIKGLKVPINKYGMIFCSMTGGLWVMPSKCEKCKQIISCVTIQTIKRL